MPILRKTLQEKPRQPKILQLQLQTQRQKRTSSPSKNETLPQQQTTRRRQSMGTRHQWPRTTPTRRPQYRIPENTKRKKTPPPKILIITVYNE